MPPGADYVERSATVKSGISLTATGFSRHTQGWIAFTLKAVIELDRFKRERPGVWTCIHTTTIGHVTIPSGVRLYAGAPVDGIDVAQMLEEAHDVQRRS